ncbi:MAG: TolC family outer membrane protein [Magnetococcales bacterium]|nr:TolC family outer membrane protein [Magnetococcales bacterium]
MLLGFGVFPKHGTALELAEAISYSLANRPEVQTARLGVAAARERVGQAYAGFLPTINLRVAAGREGTRNTAARPSNTDYLWMDRQDRSISLNQNVFDGLRTSHQVTSTEAGARRSAWKTLEAAESLAMRGVESYLTVLKYRAQFRQSEKSLATHNRLLRLAEQRFEASVGSLLEVSQARSRGKRAEAAMTQARGNQQRAEALFYSVFGMEAQGLTEPLPMSTPVAPYEVLLATALATHPAILAAQEGVMEEKAREQSHRGAYSPSANLVLTASDGKDQGGVAGEQAVQSAMLEVTVNLFSGYRDTHTQREAHFVTQQAENALAKSRLDVTEQLANAYRLWETVHALLQTYKAQAAEAQTVQEAYLEQYQLGKRTLLDLLDSESELSAARNNLMDAHYQSGIENYRLAFSQGKLLAQLQLALPDMATPQPPQFPLPDMATPPMPMPTENETPPWEPLRVTESERPLWKPLRVVEWMDERPLSVQAYVADPKDDPSP